MMHGHEKSDLVIVAMKPANKAKEAHCGGVCGGGRSGVGGAKGGGQGEYAPANTYWTQSQARVTNALERIRPLSPSHTRGGSRMRESRTYGSVRGACDETHVPTATKPLDCLKTFQRRISIKEHVVMSERTAGRNGNPLYSRRECNSKASFFDPRCASTRRLRARSSLYATARSGRFLHGTCPGDFSQFSSIVRHAHQGHRNPPPHLANRAESI